MVNATTGFINNGSLVQYGINNTSDGWDTLFLPSIEDCMLRILIDGDLPTVKGTDTQASISFFHGDIPLFSATATVSVQGASSQGADKKNFKFKVVNPTTGNKLKVKFGNWLPMSSITLKAYAVDRTLIRDSLSTMVYRKILRLNNGLTAPSSEYSYLASKNCGVTVGEADFTTAGFPIEVYNTSGFYGLYVIRSYYDAETYLLDENNTQHVLMQPKLSNNFWVDGVFVGSVWDITLPTTQDATFESSVERLFQWFKGCNDGSINMRATYKDYINLEAFIDYILFTELTMGGDSIQNNLMLRSSNATSTSGIWGIYPYDMDQTWGIIGGNYSVNVSNPKTYGWVTKPKIAGSTNPYPDGNTWFTLFWETFRPEIWARWDELRSNDIISSKSINELIQKQVSLINPKAMQEDLTLWPISGQTGLGSGNAISDNGKRYSIAYIVDFVKNRIEWLDEQLKY
ncbi:CotH kinase family protein [Commensalibacter intestini]|uniref:CotH kinase family protein n=1 Tax=Commensalibacter intestini TaxID=479936 RepID=UPI000A38FD01|nr:CotH kinase family protein [Commensalibacter intestini]